MLCRPNSWNAKSSGTINKKYFIKVEILSLQIPTKMVDHNSDVDVCLLGGDSIVNSKLYALPHPCNGIFEVKVNETITSLMSEMINEYNHNFKLMVRAHHKKYDGNNETSVIGIAPIAWEGESNLSIRQLCLRFSEGVIIVLISAKTTDTTDHSTSILNSEVSYSGAPPMISSHTGIPRLQGPILNYKNRERSTAIGNEIRDSLAVPRSSNNKESTRLHETLRQSKDVCSEQVFRLRCSQFDVKDICKLLTSELTEKTASYRDMLAQINDAKQELKTLRQSNTKTSLRSEAVDYHLAEIVRELKTTDKQLTDATGRYEELVRSHATAEAKLNQQSEAERVLQAQFEVLRKQLSDLQESDSTS